MPIFSTYRFRHSQVVGIDPAGYDFQRTSSTAISPIDPDVPQVLMDPVTRGFYDEEALMTCAVTSHVPFSVQWYRDGEPMGNRLFYVSVSRI